MNSRVKIYVSWLIASLFFLYQYIVRLAPGVMCEPIRETFGMDAQAFALLGACYQYAYALMPIPLGLLFDKKGVRTSMLIAMSLCVLGTFGLTYAPTILMAQLSRILVGIGSAAAFMGAFKIIVDEIPKGKQGFLMGVTITLGTIGAFFGAQWLVALMERFGWRQALMIVNSFGVLLWITGFFGLYRSTVKLASEESFSFWKTIVQVLKRKTIWLYAFLAGGLYGSATVLSDLWGTSFFITKFKVPLAEGATLATSIYLGMAIGGLLPWFSEKYNVINRSLRWYAFILLVLFIVLVYVCSAPGWLTTVCLLGLGVFSGAEIVCFAGLASQTTPKDSGFTIGLVNSLDMFGGACLQFGIGLLLDLVWTGHRNSAGLKIYQAEHFSWAFSLVVLVLACCWVLAFFLPKDSKKSA